MTYLHRANDIISAPHQKKKKKSDRGLNFCKLLIPSRFRDEKNGQQEEGVIFHAKCNYLSLLAGAKQ